MRAGSCRSSRPPLLIPNKLTTRPSGLIKSKNSTGDFARLHGAEGIVDLAHVAATRQDLVQQRAALAVELQIPRMSVRRRSESPCLPDTPRARARSLTSWSCSLRDTDRDLPSLSERDCGGKTPVSRSRPMPAPRHDRRSPRGRAGWADPMTSDYPASRNGLTVDVSTGAEKMV
jgi:hypothetical protein